VSDHRRRDAWALVGLGLIAVFLLVGFVITGTRMPARATVGGIDVGGMTPGQARATVDRELGGRTSEPIKLVHGDRTIMIDPVHAGLEVDVDASVRDAGGFHSVNPVRIVRVFVGHETAPLVVKAHTDDLSAVVEEVAKSVDQPPVEPLVTFDGTDPVVRKPEPGVVVDRPAAAAAIRSAYLVRNEVELPMKTERPTVGQRRLDIAMKRIVEPAISGPVSVRIGDQKISLPVSAYTPALSVRVVGVALRPHLDAAALAEPLTSATTGIAKEAVDATVTIEHGKPVVVPARPGAGLRPDEMATKLIPAITQSGAARSVTVESEVVPPAFTTDDAKKLNITQKVSEFVTYFPAANYRNVNQARAAELIDGAILKPGDTFSLNDRVGERDADNGFVKGIVIGEGAVYREEYGGGVSQVATTLYNAAFFAGLDDVEHHPHLFYIGRYPLGREATVWYGQLDLRFKNSLDSGLLIHAWVVKGSDTRRGEMHVEMWGTKKWNISAEASDRYNEREPGKRYDDTDECIKQPATEGFDVDITRTFRDLTSGSVDKTDSTHVSYAAGDEVVCGPAPTPTATPAVSPAGPPQGAAAAPLSR
jgi:vancomycin resistance protein YoaR